MKAVTTESVMDLCLKQNRVKLTTKGEKKVQLFGMSEMTQKLLNPFMPKSKNQETKEFDLPALFKQRRQNDAVPILKLNRGAHRHGSKPRSRR